MLFVNADQIAKDFAGENTKTSDYKFATLTALLRDELIEQGTAFCYETVFSMRQR